MMEAQVRGNAAAQEQQLNFYRFKLTQHEQERIEWQEQAEQARHNIERVHDMEGEITATKQQIAELQKALSDSHLSIYDEKSHLMQLAREHTLLTTQESSDQRRKTELKTLSEQIAETAEEQNPDSAKYMNYRDCRPVAQAKRAQKKIQQNKTALNPPKSQQSVLTNALIKEKIDSSAKNQAVPTVAAKGKKKVSAQGSVRGPISSARSGFSSASTNKTGGVVKTIVLPHEDINRLSSEAQELMQVMTCQKQLFEDSVAGYQKDRSVRTQEFDLKAQDFETTIAELEARLAERKQLNFQVSNDYFNYRHAVVGAKAKLEDQIALARVENEALKQQVDQICEREQSNGNYSEELYAQKTNQFAARFRKASRQNEQELNVIKVQYAQVQDQYLGELKGLESQLTTNTKRGKRIESKRTTETAALTMDIQSLRKRVTDYERHIKKLKMYIDKEDTDALVQELTSQSMSELDLGKLSDEIHAIEEEVADARRIRFH